jgi:hypothetical protein
MECVEQRTNGVKIFDPLENLIPPNINLKNGRKGMHLWKILVLEMIRLESIFLSDI